VDVGSTGVAVGSRRCGYKAGRRDGSGQAVVTPGLYCWAPHSYLT
jgi:hypothetical protein